MCKHYNTPQGCSYGNKCQFAHGPQDLRSLQGQGQGLVGGDQGKKNPLNFKIVKCKNFEKDGTCKYGSHCTFAHGDNDLRSKADNYTHMKPSSNMIGQNNLIYDYGMIQKMGMAQNFDMNQFDPNQMMMNPMMGMNMDRMIQTNNGNGK